MNCDDLGERLVERWDDQLTADESAELDRHLDDCAGCRQEADQLEALWLELGSLDAEPEVPSERLRSRFYAFLAQEQRRSQAGWVHRATSWLVSLWPSQPQAQMALMVATLVLGVGIGLITAGQPGGPEIVALRAEMADMSESVGLSLLTHPGAAERLRGVSLTDNAAADERVVSALLDLVANDPNVNVRLAAIEALARRIEQPGVTPRLLNTLPKQQSPLLQMTLLDVLLPVGGEHILRVAEPLLEREDLNEAVRDRLLEVKGNAV